MDYASYLMLSEPEILSLGLGRDTVTALQDVQEREGLSGVGGIGGMEFMDDDDLDGESGLGRTHIAPGGGLQGSTLI